MKRIITVILSVLSLFVFVACGGGNESSGTDSSQNEIVCMSKEIARFDSYQLVFEGDGVPVWTSENENVATVKDGLVFGAGKGKTRVVAEANGVKYFYEIAVSDSGKVPTVALDLVHGNVVLTAGAEYTLVPYIAYDTKSYSDATFIFESLDSSIASVEKDGKVKALGEGVGAVSIKAEWRGVQTDAIIVEIVVNAK